MYIVEVLTPKGETAYLSRGRAVRRENATHYYHPSGAKRAAESYRAKLGKAGLPSEAKVIPSKCEEWCGQDSCTSYNGDLACRGQPRGDGGKP